VYDKELKQVMKVIHEGGIQHRTNTVILSYTKYKTLVTEQNYDFRTMTNDFFCQCYQNGARETLRKLVITGRVGYVRPEYPPPLPAGYRKEDLYYAIYVNDYNIQTQEGFDALHQFMARDDKVKQITDPSYRKYILVAFLSELAEYLAHTSLELDKRNIPANDSMYDEDIRYFVNNSFKNY
jgi:hypothetical protein